MHINWKKLKPYVASMKNHSGQFLTVLDDTGNILLMNARMQKVFNLKNPRKYDINFFNLIHPSNLENFKTAIQNPCKKMEPQILEVNLKNGVYHPMQWELQCLAISSSNEKTFICKGTIIKEGLATSSQQIQKTDFTGNIFKAFSSNSPNLEWVIDEDAVLVFANQSFLNFFRLDANVINKKIIDILPIPVIDVLYGKHDQVHKSGMPVVSIEKGKTAEGNEIVFHLTLFAINDNNKRLIGGIAINQSDKFNIENKLTAATNKLNQLQKISADAIWELDIVNGEVNRNEKLIDIIGYDPEVQLGITWWMECVHPDDREDLKNTLDTVTENKLQSWQSEYRFQCQDGEYKNLVDRGFVIYDNGKPVKMIGSITDVTNEKLMENLLAEEKLHQWKIISETIIRVQEQERSRLGREMHDNVNQILSTIKLFVEMLNPVAEFEIDIKNKIREYVLLAIEEIRKLSKEMVAPQLENESLSEYIKQIIDDIGLATKLKIKFTHDAEIELLSPGKKLTLFRIVQEQIKNILKYSKASNAEIMLQCNNANTQLSIIDNGIGFDTNKTSRGVGMGSIRDRVKFYNGTMEIISAPTKGCQINISIPI